MAVKPPQETLTEVAGGSPLRPEAQYLGEHALLAVTGFFTQRFRRFAYRDIEALIIQPTSHQGGWTAGLAVALVLGLLMIWVGGGGFRVAGAIMGAASLLGLVVNLALGATCRVFLQTRVQRFRFGNVTRRPKAERLRTALWGRLEAVQGSVTAAEVRAWAEASQRAREAAATERRAAWRGTSASASSGGELPAASKAEESPPPDEARPGTATS
jgi:hypothetical protein